MCLHKIKHHLLRVWGKNIFLFESSLKKDIWQQRSTVSFKMMLTDFLLEFILLWTQRSQVRGQRSEGQGVRRSQVRGQRVRGSGVRGSGVRGCEGVFFFLFFFSFRLLQNISAELMTLFQKIWRCVQVPELKQPEPGSQVLTWTFFLPGCHLRGQIGSLNF